MNTLSWNSFTKKIFIQAPIEKLFGCWTNENGICSWFLSRAEFVRNDQRLGEQEQIAAGDKYTWFWHNWDGKETGIIIEIKNNEFVKFSFADVCEVLVKFEQHGDAVLLTLTQSKIPNDEKSKLEIFYGCSNGWTFWLANLKSYVEHGILLNETKRDLRGFDLAGFEFVNM